MEGQILTRAATAPVARSYDLAPPPRLYARDDSSAEHGPDTPLQDMQGHEIRHRPRRGHVDDRGSSVTFDEELTPTSSDARGEIADIVEAQPSVLAEIRQLLGKLWPQPLSRTEAEESIAALRKVEYDKIKPHNLEKDHVDGLPRFAALQDSNDSFCIFRRFGPAAARVLVGKEIELDQVMTRLNKLDNADNENAATRYRLRSIDFYDGCDPEQRKLLQELEVKLKDYYDFLLKYVEVRGLGPVNPRHHRSIYTWMIDHRPLYQGEDNFVLSVDDFVTARRMSEHGPQSGSRIADGLEEFIAKRPNSWLHAFLNGKTERSRTSDPYVHHYSSSRLAVLAKIFASTVAVGILLIPVFILFLVDLSRAKMSVVVGGFVLIFMGTMSALVEVTPHDLFIGIAAYCAVLVALLSNLAQGMGPGNSSTLANITAGH